LISSHFQTSLGALRSNTPFKVRCRHYGFGAAGVAVVAGEALVIGEAIMGAGCANGNNGCRGCDDRTSANMATTSDPPATRTETTETAIADHEIFRDLAA